jgi:2-polyprenyl-6-methoxyphenol hydroxylase-like FAD-dependent oxidoreductase
VEAAEFPRPHEGICLSDESVPLLRELGLLNAVQEAGFHRRRITKVVWDEPGARIVPRSGLHLDRGSFDQLALEHAIAKGVVCVQPAKALRPIRRSSGGWTVPVRTVGGKAGIKCIFVVDASGRRSVMRLSRVRLSPPLVAIHAQWSLIRKPAFDGMIAAGPDAWCWFAQTSSRTAMVSLFTRPEELRSKAASQVDEIYQALMAVLPELKDCHLGELLRHPVSCEASSSAVEDPISTNHVCVGDASMTVDPLASQGVHLAMTSGLQAAAAVHTLLDHPQDGAHAMSFYVDRQQERRRLYVERTAEMYWQVAQRRPSLFWTERAEKRPEPVQPISVMPLDPEDLIQLCHQSALRPTPILDDGRIRCGPALHHPNLPRPIAYVHGVPITQLLASVADPLSYGQLLANWQALLPGPIAHQTFHSLWTAGTLVRA